MSHFQKWDWMYGHTFKSLIGCSSHFQKWDWIYDHTFKSRIGCMVTLQKVGLDVCSLSKVRLD